MFIYASLAKTIHPDQFADILHDYQFIPEGLVNPVALALPWVELVIGACLVANAWPPSAALVSAAMTLAFIGAVVVGASLSGGDFHCGCFTTSQEQADDPWQVLGRAGLLLVATVWLLVVSCRRSRATGDPETSG